VLPFLQKIKDDNIYCMHHGNNQLIEGQYSYLSSDTVILARGHGFKLYYIIFYNTKLPTVHFCSSESMFNAGIIKNECKNWGLLLTDR